MIETLLAILFAALAWIAWLVWRQRRMTDSEAAAEVVRLRALGYLEHQISDELLRKAQRYGERIRKETGGDWS